MIPILLASIIIIFIVKLKNWIKAIIIIIFALPILFSALVYFFVFINFAPTKIIEKIYSPNKKYIAIIQEVDSGALGGDVYVFVGKNIDFGFLGAYEPRTIKYEGYWGDRPKVEFKDNITISIDEKILNIYDKEFINGRKL